MNVVRYLIVGIDPGNTIGIAALGLDGGKIALQSTAAGIDEAVRIIERIGTPSVVASDVCPAPANVLRIASAFNAAIFAPRENVREETKREIAQHAGVANAHERDAFCAATLAYRAHANKLRQIFSLEGFSPLEKEKIAHLALNGYTLRNAILSLEAQKTPAQAHRLESAAEPAQAGRATDARLQKMQEEIAALSRENAHLKKLAQTLEHGKSELEAREKKLSNAAHERIMRDNEVRKLRHQVGVLGEIIERMRNGRRAKKRGETRQQPHSKGIKKLQENRQPQAGLDMEKLLGEYRKNRQGQGGV